MLLEASPRGRGVRHAGTSGPHNAICRVVGFVRPGGVVGTAPFHSLVGGRVRRPSTRGRWWFRGRTGHLCFSRPVADTGQGVVSPLGGAPSQLPRHIFRKHSLTFSAREALSGCGKWLSTPHTCGCSAAQEGCSRREGAPDIRHRATHRPKRSNNAHLPYRRPWFSLLSKKYRPGESAVVGRHSASHRKDPLTASVHSDPYLEASSI